jgi:hypothetical protein
MKTTLRSIARLALIFLAIGSTAPAQQQLSRQPAQQPSQPATTFVILADGHIQPSLWPVLVSTFSRDAAAAGSAVPVSGNLQIIPGGDSIPGPAFPTRIEVEFLGRCDAQWDENAPAHSGPLGWVYGKPGQIAPVIHVDCAQINRMIWPRTRSMPETLQLQITSEAISHVILHEWIHIATQSPAHASHGIMEPVLSPHDLTTPIAETKTDQCKSQNQLQNNDAVLLRHFSQVANANN